MDQFHRQHLNPYVNFHRPCAVPSVITEANGNRSRVYLRWATPFEFIPASCAIARTGSGWASRCSNWSALPRPSPIPKLPATCRLPN